MKISKNTLRINLVLWPILIVITYIFLLAVFHKEVFTTQFSPSLIDRYFLSQDITHEVPGKRLFLSDEDVYIATGYLYIHGADPSEFNFEHPPFIKYLFGLSIMLFNNPLIVQVILGALVLIAVYFIGLKLFNNTFTAILGSVLLMTDPLFLDVSSQALLDIGQTLLLMLYFYLLFFKKKNFISQGIILGLFAGTKFWITPIFFIVLFALWKIYKKDFNTKVFILHIAVSFITYCLLYTQTFIIADGNFNIIWHILRTFKYRLVHNTSTYFGASIVMFTSGFYKAWWGNQEWLRASVWTLVWPIGLCATALSGIISLIKNRTSDLTLITLIPTTYLLFLGVQAPFPRYFLIILPFMYLGLSKYIRTTSKHV